MQKTEPITAKAIEIGEDALVVVLSDRRVRVPWQNCSRRLATASQTERRHAELSPGGYGIHWSLLDEDLSVSGLLRNDTND